MRVHFRWLLVVLIGFLLVLVLLMLPITQIRGYTVISGSMDPTIPRGSLVVTQQQVSKVYQVNDVIVFTAPTYRSATKIVHRVVQKTAENGLVLLSTKGDANTSGDPWTLRPEQVEGRVLFSVPHIGYLVHWLQQPIGLLLLGISGVIVILQMVWDQIFR